VCEDGSVASGRRWPIEEEQTMNIRIGDTVTIGRRCGLAPLYRVRAILPDGTALIRSLATGVPMSASVAMLLAVEECGR
jgi:acetylornithine/succinyldiaminopimelate/putrescine aminotransferase